MFHIAGKAGDMDRDNRSDVVVLFECAVHRGGINVESVGPNIRISDFRAEMYGRGRRGNEGVGCGKYGGSRTDPEGLHGMHEAACGAVYREGMRAGNKAGEFILKGTGLASGGKPAGPHDPENRFFLFPAERWFKKWNRTGFNHDGCS
jgi:hypothetical protein